MDNKVVFSAGEVRQMVLDPVKFYISPYIVEGGITLLYGKFGTFKTPLTFTMARAIASGQSLWGLNVTQAAPVLYVEADSPSRTILDRFKVILDESVDGLLDVAFCYPGFNIIEASKGVGSPRDRSIYQSLKSHHDTNGYKVVFIDALRGIHSLDDKLSETPHRVYQSCAQLFPGASIILVHHDRKSVAEETEDMKLESFSGSQAWVNHATVGIKVGHHDRKHCQIGVHHVKTQASEIYPPLILQVKEGARVEEVGGAVRRVIESVLQAMPDAPCPDQDILIAEELGCSVRTARRRRTEYLEEMDLAKHEKLVAKEIDQ